VTGRPADADQKLATRIADRAFPSPAR